MRAFHNDTTITMLSKQSTVTHGEWSLRNLDIKLYNLNKSGVEDRLVYTVRTYFYSDIFSPLSPRLLCLTKPPLTISDHACQEAPALCDQFHRAPVLPVDPGLGLLLHQRGPRRKAELQDHHTAVYLRLTADSSGHPAIHGGAAANDR